MELYQLLGIQKAFIYKTSCSATMERVLQYYSGNVCGQAKSLGIRVGVYGMNSIRRKYTGVNIRCVLQYGF